jgi:hypothetical protein
MKTHFVSFSAEILHFTTIKYFNELKFFVHIKFFPQQVLELGKAKFINYGRLRCCGP